MGMTATTERITWTGSRRVLGVRVDSHARDDLGRPAVEISRTATATGIEDQTFENPKTGAVLETAFAYQDGTEGTDLYLSMTSRDTVPPNPYRR